QSPSIHDSYFTNSQIASGFQVAGDMALQEYHDIFSCELVLGCFWQDSPEDCIAVYKRLMQSPNFTVIHERLWFRNLINPPITAWNEEDRVRAPGVWQSFVSQLSSSSNLLYQLEGRSL